MTTQDIVDSRSMQLAIEDELESLFRLDGESSGELLLARHAQPAIGPLDAASADPMLDCDGLRQSERLADRVANLCLEAVYTAPERRCFQTAKLVADLLQLPLNVVDQPLGHRIRPGGHCWHPGLLCCALQPGTSLGRPARVHGQPGLPLAVHLRH